METILKEENIMKFITMWKEYYKEVIIPAFAWVKKYWKEYFLISIVIGIGMGLYYNYLFTRLDH